MEHNKRRLVAGLTATGVLAGALAWGGVALASSGGTAQAGASLAASATTPTPTASTAAQEAKTTGAARLLRLERAGRLVVRTSAAYVGLTPAELRAQLKAGKSLASVATARGKSVSGLENAIQAALVKRIDDSKLTSARKAALITDVTTYLNAFVNAPHPFASLRGAARALDKHAAAAASPAAAA